MKLAPISPRFLCPSLHPFKLIYPIFMTEKKRHGDIEKALKQLPKSGIVILRDYDDPDRLAFAKTLRRLTRQKGHLLLVAGDARLARMVQADGVHLPGWQLAKRKPLGVSTLSAACHTKLDLYRATQKGIPLKLVSPVFKTRSHPDAKPLNIHRFNRLIGHHKGVIALGGINRRTLRKLPGNRITGYAAIDLWHSKKR